MPLKYTPNQAEAMETIDSNLLILACAGSGKTEVISRRIARLVKNGVEKSKIIAFTFTEKAAWELKARIRKHLEEETPDDPSLGDMYVGTIHSFCLQLLRELKPEYRNFDVIDEEQQVAFIAAHFDEIGLRDLRPLSGRVSSSGGRERREPFKTIELFQNTLRLIHLHPKLKDELPRKVKDAVKKYKQLLKERPHCFLDFDMIIDETIKMLEAEPDLIEGKFEHIVVDEYQDIDPRQEELIRLIANSGALLCVVGDDDQAIYGWRGADVENILTFEERYPNVKRVELLYNFRSTHAIVEIANKAVRRLPRRLRKSMRAAYWLENEDRDEPAERMAEKGDIAILSFSSEESEAEYIADRIEYLRGVVFNDGREERALDYGDMAVLYRSVRRYAAPLVEELKRRGIPFVVRGARGLFQHEEVQLIQAAFHLLAGTDMDVEEGWGRWRTLGERELREMVRRLIQGLLEDGKIKGADPDEFLEWVAAKRDYLAKARLPKEERPSWVSRRIYPQDLFHEMLEALGASKHEWNDSVLYNLGRFSTLLTKYESVHQWVTPRELEKLTLYLDRWAAWEVEEGGPDEFVTLNAVQIMTVHAAKGLEWPVVFVPSVHSRHFPSSRRNQGIRTFFESLEERNNYQQLHRSFASGNDGERRLWYVALTRAKKFLHVTAVCKRGTRPSEFHQEIEHDYASRIKITSQQQDPTKRRRGSPTPPVSAELLPTTFSDLNYFWRCPRDYLLRRLMRFGPAIGQEFGYGKQIHNILHFIHEQAKADKIYTKEEIEELVERLFNLRYTTGEPLERMKKAAVRTVQNYIDEYGQELPKLVLEAEKPFEFVLGEAMISGTIDLLEKLDPEKNERIPVAVVDFKTGISEDEEEFEARKESARKQVILYSIAVREAFKFEARKAKIHFLDPEKKHIEEMIVDERAQERLRMLVDNTVQKIKKGAPKGLTGFPTAPANGRGMCEKCDFKRICPKKEEVDGA